MLLKLLESQHWVEMSGHHHHHHHHHTGWFNFRVRASVTNWIEGCVGTRAFLDVHLMGLEPWLSTSLPVPLVIKLSQATVMLQLHTEIYYENIRNNIWLLEKCVILVGDWTWSAVLSTCGSGEVLLGQLYTQINFPIMLKFFTWTYSTFRMISESSVFWF